MVDIVFTKVDDIDKLILSYLDLTTIYKLLEISNTKSINNILFILPKVVEHSSILSIHNFIFHICNLTNDNLVNNLIHVLSHIKLSEHYKYNDLIFN